METRTCESCACFNKNLSAINPNYPHNSGCVLCGFAVRLPSDGATKTPTRLLNTWVELHDASDDATKCNDYTSNTH